MKLGRRTIAVVSCLSMLMACQNPKPPTLESEKTNLSSGDAKRSSRPDAGADMERSEIFTIGEGAAGTLPLDIVLLVKNQYLELDKEDSYEQEIAIGKIFKLKVLEFLKLASEKSHVKVAVISADQQAVDFGAKANPTNTKSGTSTTPATTEIIKSYLPFEMPVGYQASGFVQVPALLFKGGTDYVAAASCPATDSAIDPKFGTDTSAICKTMVSVSSFIDWTRVNGTLAGFYRPQAQKVIVRLARNSDKLTPEQFSNIMKTYLGKVPKFYAFNSQLGTECPLADWFSQSGDTYTKALNGKTFDPCAADWTPFFKEILGDTSEGGPAQIALSNPLITSIKSVSVDGTAIEASLISLADGVLTIDAKAGVKKGQKVTVVYTQKSL